MGTRKTPVRTFEDSLGLDLTSSALTRDPAAAIEFKNLSRLPNGSYRGRQGFKLVAQPLYIWKLHTYNYIDADGVLQEQLLAIGCPNAGVYKGPEQKIIAGPTVVFTNRYNCNGAVFKLLSTTFSVTTSATSTPWGMSVSVDCDTNTFKFTLSQNGTELLNVDLGDGTEVSPVTLKSLADQINALTDFTCFPDKTAVVNGNQTVSTAALTVDSGHTISTGDYIFHATSADEIQDGGGWVSVSTGHQYGHCYATAATTLYMDQMGGNDFADNAVIGHGLFPAAILPLTTLSEIVQTTQTLTYNYWEPAKIPFTTVSNTNDTPGLCFQELGAGFAYKQFSPPSAVTHNNSTYMSARYAENIEVYQRFEETTVENVEVNAGVWRHDREGLYLSGAMLPTVDQSTWQVSVGAFVSGTNPLGVGTYRYTVSYLYVDIDGFERESFQERIVIDTLASTVNTGNLISQLFTGLDRRLGLKACEASSTVAVASTTIPITFTNNGLHFSPGDYIFFYDDSGDLQKRKIVSIAGTSATAGNLTIDEAATITSGNDISTVRGRIWRSKVNGSELFLAHDIVYPGALSIDDTVDADLGIILSSVKEASAQYPFPSCNALAVHQGLLAASGGKALSEQVGWENPLYAECLDYTRNVSPIQGVATGEINNLISSDSYALLAAKCAAIYELNGSFSAAEVETNRKVESSYGAQGASALTVLYDTIFGACRQGLWGYSGGEEVDFTVGDSILNFFDEYKDSIAHKWIQLAYDVREKQLHVFIPVVEDITVANFSEYTQSYVTSNSRWFTFQLPQKGAQRPLWSEHVVATKYMPTGGLASYNGTLYWGSRYYDSDNSRWTGYLLKRLDGDAAENFHDNGSDYNWSFIPQWDDGDTPEYEKAWHEFELYQLQPDDFVAAFDVTFESFRDWVLDNTKRDTQRTLSFSASTTTEDKIQFDPGYKAKRRAIKLSGTVCKNPPLFTGYSYTVDDVERRKDKFGR